MQESQFVLELQHEAELKATLKALKTVLEERFGPLSADLLRRIEAITDESKAEQLHRAAIRAQRLEDLPL
jgi:hypothetical protein